MLLSWLPKYFQDKLGTSVESTGFLLILPYVVPFLTSNSSGHIAGECSLLGSVTVIHQLCCQSILAANISVVPTHPWSQRTCLQAPPVLP